MIVEHKIKIPLEVRDYIQKAWYEKDMAANLLSFLISKGTYSKERFEQMKNEHLEAFINFCLIYHEIEEEYLVPILGKRPLNWFLTFFNGEITAYAEEN
jgi:hypothetical protein